MNNPLRILQTLDRHLTAPAEITLFARARVPDIPETQSLFHAAQPKVLALAKASERGGLQTG